MRISSRRLGEFLVDRRVLSRDTLEEMLAREPSGGLSFSDLLVREGVVGEVDITAALASEVGVDFIDLTERSILPDARSEEHTSELQSLMRISYAVFCLQNKKKT